MDLLTIPRKVSRQNVSSTVGRAYRGFITRYVDPGRPSPFPATVQIEATSKCNLRCPLCSYSREANVGRHLSPDELTQILDRLPRRPAEVRLSGIGEPLVNPHFFEMVDILGRRGIACEFYTNGTLLGRRGVSEAILSRQNIRLLSVSCDGATRESFERMRVGADFDAWCAVVHEFLVDAKQARGDTLKTQVATCLSRDNINELEAIIKLVARLGFPYIYIRDPMAIDDTAAAWCPTDAEVASVGARTAALRELGRTLGVRVSFLFRRGVNSPGEEIATRVANRPLFGLRCRQPWEYVFVRVNGDVAPCCAVFGSDKIAIMGNIHHEDFEAIWRGESFQAFRRSAAAGTNELCQVCSWY